MNKFKPLTLNVKCPYPGCSHTGEIITNMHCKMAHNMTKKDVFETYGDPLPNTLDQKKLKQNMKKFSKRWI